MTHFKAFCDPGHGWVKVPREFLAELGIANKITCYSYQRGRFAYLEEDVDASTFVDAFKTRFGILPTIKATHCSGESAIRRYERYTP
jgi:hypothetical protein